MPFLSTVREILTGKLLSKFWFFSYFTGIRCLNFSMVSLHVAFLSLQSLKISFRRSLIISVDKDWSMGHDTGMTSIISKFRQMSWIIAFLFLKSDSIDIGLSLLNLSELVLFMMGCSGGVAVGGVLAVDGTFELRRLVCHMTVC